MQWAANLTLPKDPDADKLYVFDWSDWLATSDTIASASVSADSGITASVVTTSTTTVTVRVNGGTAGTTYGVSCKVTGSGNPAEVDERTVYFRVAEQ